VIPISGGGTERQVHLIQDFAPDISMVTPSYMLAILDGFRAADSTRATPAQVVIFGANPDHALRQESSANFHARRGFYGVSR